MALHFFVLFLLYLDCVAVGVPRVVAHDKLDELRTAGVGHSVVIVHVVPLPADMIPYLLCLWVLQPYCKETWRSVLILSCSAFLLCLADDVVLTR